MATTIRSDPSDKARRNSSGLARDLEILDFLTDSATPVEGCGVVAVARAIGRDKAAVSRAMATLADAGALHRDPETGLYQVGHRIFAMAARSADATLGRLARPYLRRVAAHSRETAHLCVLRGGIVLTTVTEMGPHEMHTARWEGYSTNPLRTPSGHVLISDWRRQELRALWSEHANEAAGSAAPTSPPDADATYEFTTLLDQIERLRQRGYAVSDEEFETGVVAASAPVRDHLNRVVAAINVSAPKGRVAGDLDRLGRYVAHVAGQCSTFLGAPSPKS